MIAMNVIDVLVKVIVILFLYFTFLVVCCICIDRQRKKEEKERKAERIEVDLNITETPSEDFEAKINHYVDILLSKDGKTEIKANAERRKEGVDHAENEKSNY